MLSRLFIAALWSPAGKGLASWLLLVMFNWVFVTFLCCILGQVWYLIVSIPGLCRLSYFAILKQDTCARELIVLNGLKKQWSTSFCYSFKLILLQGRRRRSGRTASAGPLFWTSMLSAVSLCSRFCWFFFSIHQYRSLRVSSKHWPSQGVKTLKKHCNYYNDSYHTYGPCREKTWRSCIRRLKVQTSLHIHGVWSVPLLFALLKV